MPRRPAHHGQCPVTRNRHDFHTMHLEGKQHGSPQFKLLACTRCMVRVAELYNCQELPLWAEQWIDAAPTVEVE